jgi:hypothetical protein
VERAPASRGQEVPSSSTCCILVTDATSYKTRHSTFQTTKHLPKTDLRPESDNKVQQWATLYNLLDLLDLLDLLETLSNKTRTGIA